MPKIAGLITTEQAAKALKIRTETFSRRLKGDPRAPKPEMTVGKSHLWDPKAIARWEERRLREHAQRRDRARAKAKRQKRYLPSPESVEARRQRAISAPPEEHGTRANYVNGCRCAPCTNANRKYHRDRRAS